MVGDADSGGGFAGFYPFVGGAVAEVIEYGGHRFFVFCSRFSVLGFCFLSVGQEWGRWKGFLVTSAG